MHQAQGIMLSSASKAPLQPQALGSFCQYNPDILVASPSRCPSVVTVAQSLRVEALSDVSRLEIDQS